MVNISDVAKKAGVSTGTVSRYLNNEPYVKRETRAKIADAINELNYIPSRVAIGLKRKKTNMIGLIVEDITNPIAAEFAKIISNYLYKLNYILILICKGVEDSAEHTERYINSLFESRVEGIISTSIDIKDKTLKRIVDINFPFVILGGALSNPSLNQVTNDAYSGGYMMTKYLINLGHERVAHITGGHSGGEVTVNRHKGYLDALKDSKIQINPKYIIEGDYTTEGGYISTRKLLRKNNWPTAIFCSNDYSAYGAIDAVLQKGLKVPDDISVAGYDDVEISSNKLINLTTISIPKYEMAKRAAEILLFKINNKNNKEVFDFKIEPQLVIRNTTRKIL